MRWQRIVTVLGKSRHCQTWLECRFSWNENLQRSKNWTAKSTILKENAGKVESIFVIRSAQWADKPGCCLEYCWSWKIRPENLRLWSTWRPLDSKGALVTVEICVLCGRWFSNQFEIMQLAVSCCEPYFARCYAVSWTGTFASESNVMCSVYLTLTSDVLIFRIPKHQSVCQGFFATEESWIY